MEATDIPNIPHGNIGHDEPLAILGMNGKGEQIGEREYFRLKLFSCEESFRIGSEALQAIFGFFAASGENAELFLWIEYPDTFGVLTDVQVGHDLDGRVQNMRITRFDFADFG